MPQPGATVILGHLTLVLGNPLGQSAYGQVWRAACKRSGRPLAIKLPNCDSMARAPASQRHRWHASLQTEIGFLRRLTHWDQRAIVRLHGHGHIGDQPAFAMELLGQDLAAWMRSRAGQAVHTDQAFAWVAQANQALEAVHRDGCRYLDLKPSNLLLTHDQRLKLADFGTLASGLAGSSDSYLGTALWQAPEQSLARQDGRYHSDWRADYFALGALLYYLVTANVLTHGRQCAARRAQAAPPSVPHQPVRQNAGTALLPVERDTFTARLRADGWDASSTARACALLAGLLEREPCHRPDSAVAISRSLRQLRSPTSLALPTTTQPGAHMRIDAPRDNPSLKGSRLPLSARWLQRVAQETLLAARQTPSWSFTIRHRSPGTGKGRAA